MQLDRTKPFGTVYGNAMHCFEQDGHCFDQDGQLISPKVEASKRAPKAPKHKPDDDSQLAAQLKD